MSKKKLGRPRKTETRDSDFAVWLRGFMAERHLSVDNIAAATQKVRKTVYGWLAGVPPDSEAITRAALMAIYPEVDRPPEQPTGRVKARDPDPISSASNEEAASPRRRPGRAKKIAAKKRATG